MKNDTIVVARKSRETDIELKLGLFPGASDIRSGIGFLDHLLTSLAHHAGWTVQLRCRGDLEVDEHHSAEDVAIVLGIAFKEALADRRNPRRFGTAYAPLDEALARAVVDLSGRPWCRIDLGFRRESIGSMATENIGHFLQIFAINPVICLHVDLLKGETITTGRRLPSRPSAWRFEPPFCPWKASATTSPEGLGQSEKGSRAR